MADTGAGGFLARYDGLLSAVASEEEKGAVGPTSAHLAIARFLVGSALSFEAIGVLNDRERRIFEARRLAEEPVTLEDLAAEFQVSR